MTNHESRGRITIRPLAGERRVPPRMTAVAEVAIGGDVGTLVRIEHTGNLAMLTAAGSIRTLPQAKVAAALDKLEEGAKLSPTAEDAARELAERLRTWRGDMPMSRAASLLGLPLRTYEGIEQGRGFRYERLLHLAMEAFPRLEA